MNDVLIIDDHLLLAQLVAAQLERDGLSCAMADLETGLDDFETESYRLVLLDLELGEGRPIGLDLIRPIIAAGSPVLVMTGTTDDIRIADALRRGASGVFRKAAGLDVLFSSVHAALQGEPLPPSDQERLRLLTEYGEWKQRLEELRAPFNSLSSREGEVLGQLSDGMTVGEIADCTFTSVSTVRSHIKAIHRKLGVSHQLRAVAMMHEANWTPTPASR